MAKRSRSGREKSNSSATGRARKVSKLVLQLTTMPALAHAFYHDEHQLEKQPWKTSFALRCSPDESGLAPLQNFQEKATVAWLLDLPRCLILHSLFQPPHPRTSGLLSTLPPLLPLLCCNLVLFHSSYLVNCSPYHTCFHRRCCMVGGPCRRLGMCYCQPCMRNPCSVAGVQPKPQPHKSIHQGEVFLVEQLEGMFAFHVTVPPSPESSCHKQDFLDFPVPAKI
jgi:hypothetical protein